MTAVDLPEVLGTTRRAVEAAGLTARFRFRAGDMFTAELSDAAFDMIILGNICHLFGPDTNRALLRRLRPALRPAGTLAIVDALPSGDPAQRQFLSLYSLGLRMRTSAGAVHPLETYTTWTQDCGYTDLSATPLSQAPPLALLTCHPSRTQRVNPFTASRAGERHAAGAPADPQAYVAAATAMVTSLRELIEAKRADPADDLLSALVLARDGADRLTEDELTSMAFLVLVAGHETTMNLIANGMLALLAHPEQLALLRAGPDRLPGAVEELLRFDGALQVATLRWTVEPVNIGGITIPAGELVVPGLLAANRDAVCAAQPDVLDITRMDNPHLAFGHGIHYCLGAALARLEGRIALGGLLTRFPRLRLAVPSEQLTWRPGVLMHGLDALPVVLE